MLWHCSGEDSAPLAGEVAQRLRIPIIGIGAGPACDGQVLVIHDALGLTTDFNPRFVRRYAALSEVVQDSVNAYVSSVRERDFPAEGESYA